jgi:hypothetical protein
MKVEVLALQRDVLGERVDKRKTLTSIPREAGSVILENLYQELEAARCTGLEGQRCTKP